MSGPAHLERTIDADQQHRWHVKGGNGEIISANTEGHPDPRTVNASILSTLDAILRDEDMDGEDSLRRAGLVLDYLNRPLTPDE